MCPTSLWENTLFLFYFDPFLTQRGLSVAHQVFVDAVVDHLFKQHIDAIVSAGTIAQLADVHAGPKPDVLLPIERPNVALCIILIPLVCHAIVPVEPE